MDGARNFARAERNETPRTSPAQAANIVVRNASIITLGSFIAEILLRRFCAPALNESRFPFYSRP
jgi:hypothetical protein